MLYSSNNALSFFRNTTLLVISIISVHLPRLIVYTIVNNVSSVYYVTIVIGAHYRTYVIQKAPVLPLHRGFPLKGGTAENLPYQYTTIVKGGYNTMH